VTPRFGSLRYALAGRFYSMGWAEWGDPAAPPLVCVHGLTRNGRDFDALAIALADRYRVICVDLPGRGRSEWLADPLLYAPPSYVVALGHLFARLDGPVAYVGTSLGGICGMVIAAAEGQPISRMVINDIGPHIPKSALARIRDYIGNQPDFADVAALRQHLRVVHFPFGPLSDAQWMHLATHSHRVLPNGRVGLHYDPAIAVPIVAAEPADADLWAFWDRISIPTLTLRGVDSDLLLPEIFARMVKAGSVGHEVADTGHAPAMMDAPTIGVVRDFLMG
jgi:pimeloyl-ACP methyl ester carboxylesterase